MVFRVARRCLRSCWAPSLAVSLSGLEPDSHAVDPAKQLVITDASVLTAPVATTSDRACPGGTFKQGARTLGRLVHNMLPTPELIFSTQKPRGRARLATPGAARYGSELRPGRQRDLRRMGQGDEPDPAEVVHALGHAPAPLERRDGERSCQLDAPLAKSPLQFRYIR
jgi:hypothetical protein